MSQGRWLLPLFLGVVTPLVGCQQGPGQTPEPPVPTPAQNAPPAVQVAGLAMNEKATATLTATATDTDGTVAGFAWSQVGGVPLALGGRSAASLTVTAPAVATSGTAQLRLTVTDDKGAATTRDVTVTVARLERAVRLAGVVTDSPVANAQVSAQVGSDTATGTADAQGNYALTVARDDDAEPNDLLTLTARGTGAQSHVEFKSAVGGFGDALAAAGADGTLTAEENGNSNVTNVTTAKYVLLAEANGGTPPATAEQLKEAEKAVEPGQVLELAAAIKLVTDSPGQYPLPEGTSTTLALASSAQVRTQFITANPAAVEQAADAITADPALSPVYTPANVPQAYYDVDATRRGFLARGGDKYTFQRDGTGALLQGRGRSPFRWSVGQDRAAADYGVLAVTFDAPVTTVSYPHDPRCNEQVEQSTRITRQAFRRTSDGAAVDAAQVSSTVERTYARCSNGTQLPAAPVEVSEEQALLREEAALPALAFTQAELAGRQLAAPFHFAWHPTITSFATELLTLRADGTGSGLKSGQSFTWSVQDGRLVLAQAGGVKQVLRWVETLGPQRAIYAERLGADGVPTAATWDQGVLRRSDAPVTAAGLTTGEGAYWQSNINNWIPSAWRGDELVWLNRFGMRTQAGGTGNQFSGYNEDSRDPQAFDDGDQTPDERFLSAFPVQRWSLVDGALRFETVNQLCNGEPCRRRDWLVLDVSADGNTLYALEQVYVRDNATPAGQYPPSNAFPPRVNTFVRWAVPTDVQLDGPGYNSAASVPATYFNYVPARAGSVSRAAERLAFRQDGTGDVLASDRRWAFTWSRTAAGELVVDYTPPRQGASFPVRPECGGGQVRADYSLKRETLRRTQDGAQTDVATVVTVEDRTFGPCTNGTQIAPETNATTTTQNVQLRDAASLRALQFSAVQLAGAQLAAPFYYEWIPGTSSFEGELLTLHGNGTGSGVKSGLSFHWAVQNGALVLTLPTGERQELLWVESLAPQMAVSVVRYAADGTPLAADYDLAVLRRPGAVTGAAALVTSGTYWQGLINAWSNTPWVGDELEWTSRFGFELLGSGTSQQLTFTREPGASDGDANPNERFITRAARTWLVDGASGVLQLDQLPEERCGNEPCARRRWDLLDVSADGNTLYVLEQTYRRDLGPTLPPPGQYAVWSSFPARLNVYVRWQVPASDTFGP
jgi:hypothetical protein